MTTSYRSAPEVERVASKLLHEVGEFRAHRLAALEFIMASESPTVAGRSVPGVAKKLSGPAAFLSVSPEDRPEAFGMNRTETLVVIVSWPSWRMMKPEQKAGLVDHLLSHFWRDGESGRWHIEPPEFGEFRGTLHRHGLWRHESERRRLTNFVGRVQEHMLAYTDHEDPTLDDALEDAADTSPDTASDTSRVMSGQEGGS